MLANPYTSSALEAKAKGARSLERPLYDYLTISQLS